MADPPKPTVLTRIRARIAGERDTVLLEGLRAAGRAAYEELLAAERARDELRAAGDSPWTAPPGVGSHLLAAWNASVLQQLGETLLDADHAHRPGGTGFVPPVTFTQARAWLSQVEGWVSRARQARANPDYDVAAELDLPADLPPWAGGGTVAAEHLGALLDVLPAVRGRVDVAVHALHGSRVPAARRAELNRLRQLAARAAAAADYAAGLTGWRGHTGLDALVEAKVREALETWFHVGQYAALPRLLARHRQAAAPPRVDGARLPGGARFDPWCLTDPRSRDLWRGDPRARRAVAALWRRDPDPAATLALQDDVDRALADGAVVPLTVPGGGTCYWTCPWSGLYETRRAVRVGGRALRPGQQFAVHVVADGDVFRRGVVPGPFVRTDDVAYRGPGDG